MITLTSAVLADPSGVRTWSDFAMYLSDIHRRSGMSLTTLQRTGKIRAKANPRFRDLPTSTVSDALSGKRPIKKDLLESLLAAWQTSPQEREAAVGAWQRLNAAFGQGPANAGHVDEASPRELGVHPAISTGDATSDLPGYVTRDFDERLRDLLAQGVEDGCFIVLMGRSSCGKTRSLYEAVRSVLPDWWLVQPTRTQEILDLLARPTERTVLWLDEFHRYLGADKPLQKADIVALVRAGTIVVGTLWPAYYFAHKQLRQSGADDTHLDGRLLLEFAEVIRVPDILTVDERRRAGQLAATDRRIEAALAVSDAGLTQVLAAGPDLVNSWEQAPDPYGKAIISAAADARRLGVHSPLPAQLLTEAMAGYPSSAQRVPPPTSWLGYALRHATAELHGAVSALTPLAGEQAGSVAGYVVADYLTQHISRVRRGECPPASLWKALANHLQDLDDLRRLASTAFARMRYRYAEQALRRLHQASASTAVVELATLLQRQDRLGEAISLVDGWRAADPRDEERRAVHAALVDLQARAEQLRRSAAEEPGAGELLAELLADGGRADALRTRAAAGDAVAAEDLADVLADRGCLDELRVRADAGHRFAAERLAELLASLGRADELQRRAGAGDLAAALHLARLGERDNDAQSRHAELRRLRVEADSGDEVAATELTALLSDTGDRDGMLAEVNAGTYLAAERYLALLTADPDVDRGRLRQLQAFGLRADGLPDGPGAAV